MSISGMYTMLAFQRNVKLELYSGFLFEFPETKMENVSAEPVRKRIKRRKVGIRAERDTEAGMILFSMDCLVA